MTVQPTQLKITWPQPGNTITRNETGMVYTIGPTLNQGGYALVYEGIDSFGNPIALKVLKPANRPFNEVQAQWNKEAALFEKLRHPNIVAIYDSFVCENLFYIVLERAWGSLADYIKVTHALNELNVKQVARQLLFALHFIHLKGVLQRDLTIYNVLVFHGPEQMGAIFKISDFGISQDFVQPWLPRVSYSKTAHPLFKPPEMVTFGFTNQQSDLYHLGLILLYCLTGALPFTASMTKQQIDKAITDGVPRQMAEAISTPFGDFVSVLLRRHQDYRFKTALEAWEALRHL